MRNLGAVSGELRDSSSDLTGVKIDTIMHDTHQSDIDSSLLKKYDRAGPRYTSYPTAVEFHSGLSADDYARRLSAPETAHSVSLYLHLPFCEHRCTFCGCHVIATRRHDVAEQYLAYIERELELVTSLLATRPRVVQYHWGGGTPTYFSPEQLRRLHDVVLTHFDFDPGAEIAIEVDPRVTSHEHIDALVKAGFNRVSMGVQDFDPSVQEAIGRHQDEASTRELFNYSRQVQFESINLDLIYGLPNQTEESFSTTVNSAIALRPDRVALYSYAHVPWIRGHQKNIDTELLPPPELKLGMFMAASDAFVAAGYERIGMDHFALPTDELSKARREHRLHRNFMGYTPQAQACTLGFGISAIGDLHGDYFQNVKKLSDYFRQLDRGKLPVERGWCSTPEDHIRRYTIHQILCNLRLDFSAFRRRFQCCFRDHFAPQWPALQALEADGLLELSATSLRITSLGRLFVRNICMTFDAYLTPGNDGQAVYSRTV